MVFFLGFSSKLRGFPDAMLGFAERHHIGSILRVGRCWGNERVVSLYVPAR